MPTIAQDPGFSACTQTVLNIKNPDNVYILWSWNHNIRLKQVCTVSPFDTKQLVCDDARAGLCPI